MTRISPYPTPSPAVETGDNLADLPQGYSVFWEQSSTKLVYVHDATGQRLYTHPVKSTESARRAPPATPPFDTQSLRSPNPSEMLPAYTEALSLNPAPGIPPINYRYDALFSQTFDKRLYGCKNHRVGHCACKHVV